MDAANRSKEAAEAAAEQMQLQAQHWYDLFKNNTRPRTLSTDEAAAQIEAEFNEALPKYAQFPVATGTSAGGDGPTGRKLVPTNGLQPTVASDGWAEFMSGTGLGGVQAPVVNDGGAGTSGKTTNKPQAGALEVVTASGGTI